MFNSRKIRQTLIRILTLTLVIKKNFLKYSYSLRCLTQLIPLSMYRHRCSLVKEFQNTSKFHKFIRYTILCPEFFFHHFLLDIFNIWFNNSKYLSAQTTFIHLHVYEKCPDYVLKRPLYRFRFQYTSQYWKSTCILHCISH